MKAFRLTAAMLVLSLVLGSSLTGLADPVTTATVPSDPGDGNAPAYQMKLDAGLVVDPGSDAMINDLESSGELTPEDIAAPNEVYRQHTLIRAGGFVLVGILLLITRPRMPVAPQAPKPQEPKPINKVVKTIGKVGLSGSGVLMTCTVGYITDPSAAANQSDERQCSRIVRTLTGSETAAMETDRVFGRSAETMIYLSQAATAYPTSHHSLLVFQKGGYELEVWGGQERKVPIMNVSPYLAPSGRLVIPVRYLEQAGLTVDWFPDGRIVLTRPSDGKRVTYHVGQNRAEVSDGTTLTFDVNPFIDPDSGRTMIGLRSALSPFCVVMWLPYHEQVLVGCDH